MNTEQTQRNLKEAQVEGEKKKFVERIAKARDLRDHLQDLTDHLKQFTHASAIYIGKLVSPKKPIKEGDDDHAHENESSEKIIHFSHADAQHKFIVDQTLSKTQGLTFDVFEDKLDDEGKPIVRDDLEHVLVKEVVREPRIHFFKVPRLGSYLAIRLEYQSCLSVEAYNDGVRDALSCRERLKEQEEQKREHDEREKDRKEECEANDQEYVRDEGNWPKIKPKPFTTQKVQYVVCLNTLGQDREFTAEEIQYALDTVKLYRNEWERIETDNMRRDIARKLDNMEAERVYRELHEPMDTSEAEKRAEEFVSLHEQQEPLDEF